MSRVSEVAQLHKAIRDGNFDEVHELVLSSFSSPSSLKTPLLWKSNSIGWTALHCCASHGTPNMDWWRWVLTRALYEKRTSALLFQNKQPNRNTFERMGEDLKTEQQQKERKKNMYYNNTHCIHHVTKSTTSRDSFVHTRTDFFGYSIIDLFFVRHLFPLSWQRSSVHHEAKILKEAIQYVVSPYNSSRDNLLELIRKKITTFQSSEQERQISMITQMNDDDVPLVWIDDDFGINQYQEQQPHDVPTNNSISDEIVNDSHAASQSKQQQNKSIVLVAQFWCQMELLLMAAHWNTLDFTMFDLPSQRERGNSSIDIDGGDTSANVIQKRNKWRVIHALASVNCPKEVARLALALYPDQAMERDEYGYLPLHIVATSPSCTVVTSHYDNNLRDNGTVTAAEEGSSSSPSLSSSIIPDNDDMMELLLKVYPQGAQCPDPQGRLPINIALAFGKTWETGVQTLVKACPYVILSGTRDIPTGLFCFLLAAVVVEQGEQSKLLRAKRHISKSICGNDGGSGSSSGTVMSSSCWRFLPSNTKERVMKDAEKHIDILQLNTVFELLRTMPEAVRSGISL